MKPNCPCAGAITVTTHFKNDQRRDIRMRLSFLRVAFFHFTVVAGTSCVALTAQDAIAADKVGYIRAFSSQSMPRFALSPDGNMATYIPDTVGLGTYWADGNPEWPGIWLKDLKSGEVIRLPGFPQTMGGSPWPRWSPDGSRLAYVAADKPELKVPFQVYIWDRVSGRHTVHDVGYAMHEFFELEMQWSPDGRTLYLPTGTEPLIDDFASKSQEGKEEENEKSFLSTNIGRQLVRDPQNKGISLFDSRPIRKSDGARTLFSPAKRPANIIALDVGTGAKKTVFAGHDLLRIHLSPDGKKLAVVSSVPFAYLPYRGATAKQDRASIYVVPLVGRAQVAPMRPTAGAPDDGARDAAGNPVVPMIAEAHFFAFNRESWSPDSNFLAYAEQGGATEGDMMLLDVRTGKLRNLTSTLDLPPDALNIAATAVEMRAFDYRGKFGGDSMPPVWSRDAEILYARHERHFDRAVDFFGRTNELWAISATSGAAKNLMPDADFSVSAILHEHGIAWSAEGQEELLLAVRFKDGQSGFVRLDPRTGRHETVIRFAGKATRGLPYYSVAGKQPVLLVENERIDAPPELYQVDMKSGRMAQATHINAAFAGHDLPEFHGVRWRVADGRTMGGRLYLPPKSKRAGNGKLPVIVEIYPDNNSHASVREQTFIGHDYFGEGDSPTRERRLWDDGYAIFYPDVPFRMGGHTCKDIAANTQAALDAVGATGLVDTDRAGVLGASFGGYSVNCVVTHSTRFKAAVSIAGLSDLISDDVLKGNAGGGQALLGVTFPDGIDRFIANSPIFHIDKVETPLLLLHGKSDPNVFVSQSILMFRGLNNLGKTARLVTYDGNDHGITNPDGDNQTLAWFDRWVKSANP